MKLTRSRSLGGFSLGEMMVVTAITITLLAASFTSLGALTKSFSAADNYFSTHLQQIRIIDYLSRDVKRSTIVTTSTDRTAVTCTVPNYVVQEGDPEALSDPASIGKRRTPSVTITSNGAVIDYGRTVKDAAVSEILPVITSSTAKFTAADVGKGLAGPSYLKAGTTIISVASSTSAVMSRNAIQTGTGVELSIIAAPLTVAYTLDSQEIRRVENSVQTAIAKSTDRLVPETTDIELANTEKTVTNVTFLPTFNFNQDAASQTDVEKEKEKAKRNGTSVHSTSFLRNKRRG